MYWDFFQMSGSRTSSVAVREVVVAVCLSAFLLACSDDSSSSSRDAETNVPASSSSHDSLAAPVLPFVGGPVMFTEVDPINIGYEDHEGDDAGWVEIFNTSADTVDLSGMFLTDTQSEPFKWKFGNVKVAPNSFLLVFMSGKNYPDYVLPIRLTWLEVVAGLGPMRRTIRRDSVMRTRFLGKRKTALPKVKRAGSVA